MMPEYISNDIEISSDSNREDSNQEISTEENSKYSWNTHITYIIYVTHMVNLIFKSYKINW